MRSSVLVALQLSLMAAIALPFGIAGWTATASAIVAGGLAVGAWALSANRPGNFNVRPEPKTGGQLVTGGPYRFVRHPMYLAVLLVALGCCVGYGTSWRWGALAGLGLVLAIKARVEERALTALHPGYADYARRSKRIVPLLW
jgi:protein-S-isoprenylcysteine O-methyltransferase Ste14